MVSGLAEDFDTTFSLIEVGLISAIPFGCAAVAMWWAGRHSDRTGERIWHTALPPFLGAAGLAVALLFDDSPYILMAGLVLLAVGVFAAIPSFWSLPSTFLAGAALAGGIGLINSFGNLSGFVGPYLTGWLKDWTGSFRPGLFLVAGFMALAPEGGTERAVTAVRTESA
jgi:MFS family permease